MARRPTPLPDALPSPVFTTVDALSLGIPAHRLLARDVQRLRTGLYLRAGLTAGPLAVAQALCRNDPSVVVVGTSAARCWGMPLPRWISAWPLTLAIPPSSRRESDDLVRWVRRRLDETRVIHRDGVRILDRVGTWASLGSELSVMDLVVIADHLLRRPRACHEGGRTAPYATRDQLEQALEATPGIGRPRAREALALARVGSDSPMETRLRLALRAAGLPEPVLNQPVDEAELGPTPDMMWPRFRVAAEYDGDHHLTREQRDRDILRAERFRRLGWLVVLITSRDMQRGARPAVARVEAALRERGWEPGTP
ncbi:hypothetical protein JSY14_04730 [Brachybacterium sp. EF45031]|uniref:endonuclease domain-containing protein n=1 Tax=Brachybacterium sillae TaxID=2810536 RepID=UPI00217F0996|nr:hypothetical protein [Brachybacterium sillae]MCS6711356.1 hypothetical protein [Brachybacterium sillae]